jgi:hypothetical protein
MRCAVKGCPLCYSGRRGREVFSGHWGWRQRVRVRKVCSAMGMLKRPVVREAGGLPCVSAASPLARSYPALFAFVTETTWDDGTVREPGTFMVMSGDGLLKLWLHDREGSGRSAWAAGEALEDALAAADDMIATGSGEWRVDRPKGQARKPGRT